MLNKGADNYDKIETELVILYELSKDSGTRVYEYVVPECECPQLQLAVDFAIRSVWADYQMRKMDERKQEREQNRGARAGARQGSPLKSQASGGERVSVREVADGYRSGADGE